MRIMVNIKLHKHSDAVIEIAKGIYEVHTTQPPIDNRANEDAIRQLAEYFKIPKSSIKISSGKMSKQKIMEIPPI